MADEMETRGEVCTVNHPECDKLMRKAKQDLILRNFTEVVKITEGLCGLHSHCTKCIQLKVGFGILAIQAFALNRTWQEGMVFAEKSFGKRNIFPVDILQTWICVHLKYGRYEDAVCLTEAWLREETNHRHKAEYENTVELYIQYILLPQEKMEEAERFLVDNTVMSECKKQKLLLCIKNTRGVTSSSKPNTVDTTKVPDVIKANALQESSKLQRLADMMRFLPSIVYSREYKVQVVKTVARLAVLICFFYLLISRTDITGGFVKGSGPSSLWTAIGQIWQALFAPYYTMQQ